MATTYLKRSQGTATNAKKFTYSVWLKRSSIGVAQRFYQGRESDNNRFYFKLLDTDILWLYGVTGGTGNLFWQSTRKFRDNNGWYHFVFKGDTTQASQDDRFRVYVNGVEETAWTKSTNISQNDDWGNQIAGTDSIIISGTESQGEMFDGLMSHIHYIDGTAYAPTEFGETDSTTGEWKIKTSPSVTYGDQGYFILKNGNSVTDQSGEGNNFTVGAGTLTNTEDCPDNVFATWNPLVYSANPPIFKYGNTEEEGQSDSRYPVTISTLAMPKSGKFYAEFKKIDPSNDKEAIGIADTEKATEAIRANTDVYVVGYEGQACIKKDGTIMTYGSEVSGYVSGGYGDDDIVQVAFDGDNGAMYFGKNGTWGNSGDPTSGASKTGAMDISGLAWYTAAKDLVFLAGEFSSSGYGHFQANFGNGYFGTTAISSEGTNASGIGKFEYDVPTGYTALSTKGLNE